MPRGTALTEKSAKLYISLSFFISKMNTSSYLLALLLGLDEHTQVNVPGPKLMLSDPCSGCL